MQTSLPFWIVVGDIHEQTANIHRIPHIGEAAGLIVSGDITNAGRVAKATEVLEELHRVNPNLYAQIGNMDFPEVTGFLEQRGWNIHARGVELDEDVGLMGVGYSNATPFGTPAEVGEHELHMWLDVAYADIKDLAHHIVVCHTPPYGTRSDALADGTHVGSHSVRRFLEAVQPDVCVTGHIHEAVSQDYLGRTLILNPGMLAAGGYVLLQRTAEGIHAELRSVREE